MKFGTDSMALRILIRTVSTRQLCAEVRCTVPRIPVPETPYLVIIGAYVEENGFKQLFSCNCFFTMHVTSCLKPVSSSCVAYSESRIFFGDSNTYS